MLVNYHKNCRVCNNELISVYNFGDQCLDGLFELYNFKPPTRKLPLELCFCIKCNLAQSRISVDPDILYSSYGYVSSLNTKMTQHLDKIVTELDVYLKESSRGGLIGGKIQCLDIGSNDFYLLNQYPKEYMRWGIDPGYYTPQDDIIFINDIYPSVKLTGSKFHALTAIACFYDCNDPIETAKAISNNLHHQGIAVVEVSYWTEKIKKTAFDELCREHVCFYTYENLEVIFESVGLKIFRAELNDINGGSIQLWICHSFAYEEFSTQEYKRQIAQIKIYEFQMAMNDSVTYMDFVKRCEKLKYDCMAFIHKKVKEEKKVIHLLGASTKISVLLSYFGLTNEYIPYAAERNPTKWGGKMLGSNIKMISEEESRKMKPDYYFVGIWGFRNSVIEREKEFINKGGKLIFPIGENGFEVYPNNE
jgi:ATP-dependent Clp protease adapter protein ClpS